MWVASPRTTCVANGKRESRVKAFCQERIKMDVVVKVKRVRPHIYTAQQQLWAASQPMLIAKKGNGSLLDMETRTTTQPNDVKFSF